MRKNNALIGIVFILIVLSLSGCNEVNLSNVTQFSITSFKVEPSLINIGETANLSWMVISAETVNIDNGIGNVSNIGERIIQPSQSITYTLTARNGTKILTAFAQIIVRSNDNNENDSPDSQTPNLQFVKDDVNDRLTVASADSGLSWSDLEITGTYTVSSFSSGDEVHAGDYLSGCSEVINIRHIPTNTLLLSFTFSDISISYTELLNNYDVYNDTFLSYEDGEKLIVKDVIDEVYFMQNDLTDQIGYEDGLTLVNISGHDDFPLGYPGDVRSEFDIGIETIIIVTVKEYEYGGESHMLLEELEYHALAMQQSGSPEPQTPNLQFVKDSVNDRLTVASADSGLSWSDFEVTGDCDMSSVGSTVEAGDMFTECSGTITIRYIPLNTLIGMWDFT